MGLQKNAKVYTMWWIVSATYLGGPLAGAYLMSQNFEVLNKKYYAQNTFRIGIVSLIILLLCTLAVMMVFPQHFS